MKLPFLEKKEKAEYYLALVLRNEKATSIIFEKIGTTIKYISHGEEEFKNTVEDAETEEFLDVLDKTITQAEEALPESIETHKTIFGLKESWIEDNKIKKEYLEKLKKASEELSLDPIGFLVFAESIINLVQKDEGAPITAVLADIGSKFITVSLIKSGRIIETKSSEIHENASFTVDTLLKHFQAPEVMPARIILLDSEEEELTQEFMNHQWSKSLPFLHLPQIISLPQDAVIKAMLLGAATQMGTELLYDSTGIDMDNEPKKLEPMQFTETKHIETPVEEPEKINQDETGDKDSFEDNLEETATNETLSEDAEQTKLGKTEKPLDYIDHDDSLEYFGFTEDADVAKTPLPKTPVESSIPDALREEIIDEAPEEAKIETERKMTTPAAAGLIVERIRKTAELVLKNIQRIKIGGLFSKLTNVDLKKRTIIVIPVIIILLLLIVVFYFYSSRKITVSILVNPKQDSKTASVTFSSSSPTDVANSTIASQSVSVSEDGTVTETATGKKDVGTSAKGKVTIFNVGDTISLASGTIITAPNDLKYTLDDSVDVASGDATLASTATVNITSADIGQDYNLPSGTKFSVSGQDSTVAAKNDNAFSGGSKKQITVISADDIQKALTDLPKQLEDKAKNDIKVKAEGGDNALLGTFVDESVDKKSFDKKLGDQVNQITLSGTVTFTGLSYKNSDIVTLANSLFNSPDMQLSQDNLTVSAENVVTLKNSDVSADLKISANLLPKIDTPSLIKQIAGNSLQKTRNIISNFPQVENVGILINPDIPFLPQNLPNNPKNITIQVTAK
jgi:hypothetical protein